jgi:hypothetical protein
MEIEWLKSFVSLFYRQRAEITRKMKNFHAEKLFAFSERDGRKNFNSLSVARDDGENFPEKLH